MVGSVSIEIEVLELPGTEPFYVYKCAPSYSTIALTFSYLRLLIALRGPERSSLLQGSSQL